MEQGVGRKARRDIRTVGGCRVDAAEHVADGCGGPPVGFAVDEQLLPDREVGWRQPGHGEGACDAVFAQDLGHRAWHDATRHAQPLDLPAVALNRDAPVRGDLEPAQRAFDANDAAGQRGAVDVRRNAAGERRQFDMLVSTH